MYQKFQVKMKEINNSPETEAKRSIPKSTLHYTGSMTPKHVTSGETHLRSISPGRWHQCPIRPAQILNPRPPVQTAMLRQPAAFGAFQ